MNESILIVEDESAIADTMQYALENDGFSSCWVTTAHDALCHITDNEFDLVILDVGLPDMNGFELLKEIRNISDLPVIFLTARNAEIDRVVGLEIGADDYVTKPFSPREVVARVKVILKRVGRRKQPVDLSNRKFEVDSDAAVIRFLSCPLQLTKAEFVLLQTLLERPGMVYSRARLMESIWEHPHPSDERTIDTHIKTIRAKLRGIDPDVEPISTHRGLGYSIDP
ncbi:MAG: two-component system response regulator CreB [Candidatus Thiodiazotropha sp. (ex Dulcina madagascariensis)]|nr:two-component system response regulator CreB [Candidatus Thiodiazotropha sp. (ex Dulcina madagascariensis)]